MSFDSVGPNISRQAAFSVHLLTKKWLDETCLFEDYFFSEGILIRASVPEFYS